MNATHLDRGDVFQGITIHIEDLDRVLIRSGREARVCGIQFAIDHRAAIHVHEVGLCRVIRICFPSGDLCAGFFLMLGNGAIAYGVEVLGVDRHTLTGFDGKYLKSRFLSGDAGWVDHQPDAHGNEGMKSHGLFSIAGFFGLEVDRIRIEAGWIITRMGPFDFTGGSHHVLEGAAEVLGRAGAFAIGHFRSA